MVGWLVILCIYNFAIGLFSILIELRWVDVQEPLCIFAKWHEKREGYFDLDISKKKLIRKLKYHKYWCVIKFLLFAFFYAIMFYRECNADKYSKEIDNHRGKK